MKKSVQYGRTILVLVFILVTTMGVFAQDDDAEAPAAVNESGGVEIITFESEEDASLFVGHYRLNPGDTIHLEIITEFTRAYDSMIDYEGFVVIPVLGSIKVADLTLTEVRQLLQELADEYYLRAWVTCRIVKLSRVRFYIYGDVGQPGFYTANAATTFFDFLQRLGFAGKPSHRRIVHVRGECQTALPEPVQFPDKPEEPISDLIERSLEFFAAGDIDKIDTDVTIIDPLIFTLEGEIEQRNFYIEYGDVIFIPDPLVIAHLDGFKRSGVYEVLPGETWTDLIRLAGQPILTRDMSNLLLERYDEEGNLMQLYYNLNCLDEEQIAMVPLENRDRLRILYNESSIYVLGEIGEAGAYPYDPTFVPLDYITLAGGATQDAHLRFAVIVRPPRDPSAPLEQGTVFEVNLVETLLAGTASTMVAMQPGDILFIPDKGDTFSFSTVLSSVSVLINAIRLFE